MKKTKKIFLPKWQRWYVGPLLLGVWLMAGYMEYFSTSTGEKMGTIGFLLFTLVLAVAGSMTWLMTSGKLPAYIIEEDDTEN